MGLSDILGDVGGGFLDATTKAYHWTPADDAVSFVRLDDAGRKVWNEALKPTLNGFEYVYRNGVSRPMTTLMLMQDDEVEHGMGWGGAWKASRNISPGQAFANSMANRLDDAAQKVGIDDPLEWVDSNVPGTSIKPFAFFGDDIENSFEELTGSGGKSEFDIFNEEQRKEVFSHNFAKFMSGASDTALRWFLDPTVIAGKVAMIGRARLLLRPLEQKTLGQGLRDSVREGTALDAVLPARKVLGAEEVTARVDKALGARVGQHLDEATGEMVDNVSYARGRMGSTAARIDTVARRYMDMPPADRRSALLRDKRLGRVDPAIAEVLARSEGVLDFKNRLRTMMNPTNINVATLADRSMESRQAFDDFVRYSENTKPGIEDAMREADEVLTAAQKALGAGKVGARGEVAAAQATRREAYDSMESFLQAEATVTQRAQFDRLMRDANRGLQGKQVIPARLTVPQRIGDVRPRLLGQADQFVYQASRFSAVRVVRAATTPRVGAVIHDDASSVGRELGAFMDQAGHGVRQSPFQRGGGIAKDVRDNLMGTALNAALLGKTSELQEAILAIETAGVSHVAAQVGVREDVARSLYEQFHAVREATLKTFAAQGNEQAFSGVKLKDGQMADMWFPDESGAYTKMIMANSDLVNVTPLLDLREFTRLLRKQKLALDAEGDGIIAALSKEGGRDLGQAWDVAKNKAIGANSAPALLSELGMVAMQRFNQLWKPLQLFRLGWPARVIVDEQMRIMASLGTADYMENVTRSLGNSLAHGGTGMLVKNGAHRARNRIAQLTVDKMGIALPSEKKLAQMLPERTREAHRLNLIDELDQLTQTEAAHNVVLEATRRKAQAAIESVPGTRIYRQAPKTSPIRPGELGTEFRYDLPEEALSAGHVHQYALADLPEDEIFRVASGDSAGGAAFLAEAAPDLSAQINAMTKDELRAHIASEFPDAKIARSRKHGQMVDAYGVLMARQAGYKAIDREGVGVTALTDDAIAKIHPDEPSLMAKVEELQEQARDYGMLRTEITGDIKPMQAWTAQMETDYQRLASKSGKFRQLERGHELRPSKFDGDVVLTHNGVSVIAPGAGAGAYGKQFIDLTSAKSTTRALAGLDSKHISGMRVVGGDTTVVTSHVDDSMTAETRKLVRETYDGGWETAANRQLGTDQMMRQLLAGKTEEEVLDWLQTTEQGRRYLDKTPSLLKHNLEEWISRAQQQIDQYLPDPALRQQALDGTARAKDLRDWARSQGRAPDDLPPVHAASLDLVLSDSKFWSTHSKIVDSMYAKLGTAPTDVLSRQPFFNAVYEREMQRMFEGLAIKHPDELRPGQIEEMAGSARKTALAEVKKTLYDVANQSNLGHTMRFMMPFYAAWQDALQTWGRLWMEDPSRLAHMAQAWEAPSKGGQTYTSPEGQTYVAAPLPSFAKKLLHLDEHAMMPTDALRSLIFQGKYWYLPGFGAPVTVPVSELVRERPDLETLLQPVIPFGAGDSWTDQVLPAGWKKGQSLFSEEDDSDYSKALVRMAQDVYTKNRLEHTNLSDEQMWDEAKRRTNSLFSTRMAANLSLPFSVTVTSPYQLYIDTYRKMQEQYRTDPNVFGGKSAQDQFLDTQGEDYFMFTLAATKSNVGGIAPTKEGYEGFNEFKDLVREMPEMGSLIVGDTNGDYSAAVSDWMLKERIGAGDTNTLRDIRDPKTAFADAEVNRGWTLFRQIDNATDADLAKRGLSSLRSRGAEDLKATRDVLVDRIKKQYPAWAEEYGTFDRTKTDRRVAFMEKLVSDKRVQDRPGFRSLIQYLDIRRQVARELQARPSHNLQAVQNSDLRAQFEILVNRLRQGDTAFAGLHTRWLSSDDLDTGGLL